MGLVHVKYLLLGGGSAAASAAEAIRARDPSGEIMLVSGEAARPYHRPPLARGYLRRELKLDDLAVHGPEWYGGHGVALKTSTRALALDVAKRTVALSDGTTVGWEVLLIGTGATPRGLEGVSTALPGAMTLRTIDDAERIHHAADVALTQGRGRVVVTGSGLLAMEVAASLAVRPPAFASGHGALGGHPPATGGSAASADAARGIAAGGGGVLAPHRTGAADGRHATAGGPGLAVTLVAGRGHLLEGLAGEYAGRVAARALEALGVRVSTGRAVAALEGDGRVQRAVLADGERVACDFAVVAEGFVPSKDLLRGTPIAAEKAILTDARGRTSVEGVFAAGECAAMLDPVFGKHRLLDHWDVTVSRGLVVGANMAGEDAPWAGVTTHRAEVPGLRVVVMGEPRFAERRIVRDAGDQGVCEFGVDREGRVTSAVLLNWRPPEGVVEGLVRRRESVEGREDDLRDPSRGL